jgi:hypothetical protein
MDFRSAARVIFDRGWVPLALGPDAKGKPKRPLVPKWSEFTHDFEAISAQPWESAGGLGILLGAASDNLAVVDIDDTELAEAVFAYMVRQHALPRFVWTVSRHAHVYCREDAPTHSRMYSFLWEGRTVRVELKTTGTQVAAPPTPGYHVALVNDEEPSVFRCRSIAEACVPLFDALGLKPAEGDSRVGGNFPAAWRDHVGAGERNNTMYIEAHKLREAGISMGQALDLLRTRFESSYAGGDVGWDEMEKTIMSAYRKGERLAPGHLGGIAL